MSPTHRWSHHGLRRAVIASTPTQGDADAQPTPVRLVQDTIQPAVPTFVPDAATTSSASLATEKTSPVTTHGMSNAMKLGLAMIPVVVILAGSCILFIFWYRKRRSAHKQIQAQASPRIPEKDMHSSYVESIASRKRSSKVLNMAAFSTPLDGPYPRIQPTGQSAARVQAHQQFTLPMTDQRRPCNTATPSSPPTARYDWEPVSLGKKDSIHVNRAAAASCPDIAPADDDSPIDGSSPFRLKRGDTVKRCSLGSDLFRLWPTPPTSVWMKPMSVYENMYEEVAPLRIRRQDSTYQPPSRLSE